MASLNHVVILEFLPRYSYDLFLEVMADLIRRPHVMLVNQAAPSNNKAPSTMPHCK